MSCQTKDLRKYQESLKTWLNNSLVPSLPVKMTILLILAKKFTFPVVRYFAWKLVLVSNILWMIVDATDKSGGLLVFNMHGTL